MPPPAMRIGLNGLDLIKSFESFVGYVYDDLRAPKGGKYAEWDGGPVLGTLTIGYGHTNAARHPLKITRGLRITEAEALAILDVDLDECEEAVNRLVTRPLRQGQFDALVSFTFNCGIGSLKNIAARINAGKMEEARAALLLYKKSMGRELAGLTRRRRAEQALWDDLRAALPSTPVHHPAEVDEPAPPAQIPPPPDIEPVDAPPPEKRDPAPVVVLGGGALAAVGAWLADNPWVLIGGIVAVLAALVAFDMLKKRKD